MRRITSLLVAAALVPVTREFGSRSTLGRRTTDAESPSARAVAEYPTAVANDNRTPAGRRVGDTLVLRLVVTPVVWHLLGDNNPGFRMAAFAEEGKPATIPAPLIRVRAGTPIHVVIRNPLADTLVVRGFSASGSANDSVVVLPDGTADVRVIARSPGTYQYWASLASAQRMIPAAVRDVGLVRARFDSQLVGPSSSIRRVVFPPIGFLSSPKRQIRRRSSPASRRGTATVFQFVNSRR